ncbi:hypothetical protein DICPUDRAFT_152111 [Dictyostelium purpureum]|uniref:CHK kinase-like domain-containing protein n=1 Tax=Dictyostelium purpureum TaxID=5786 RepID=F0ZKI4_DICPU|nr:uncharacterized protein DICPUDRAFT_152111 [Dictyostelium purpureum]EGC35548.1 hypothetical protein DICPUDRAFT_152111 [Dictyostelium purpureum]|eukprot:XP_003287919.1 hypothetical protein DICPUDRAFT_152111 [Dictyostelium purpureum]
MTGVISKEEITLDFLNSVIKDSNDSSSKIIEFTCGNPLEGGFVGYIIKLSLKWNNDNKGQSSRPNSVIFKCFVAELCDEKKLSALKHSHREVDFYNYRELMNSHGKMMYSFVPKTYYRNKTPSGSFAIIMQDLSELTNEEIKEFEKQDEQTSFQKKYITACKALGNQCWGLPQDFNLSLYDPYKIFEDCFLETSKLHIEYFRDSSILKEKNSDGVDMTWLKNFNVYNGEGKEKWMESKEYLVSTWKNIALPKIAALKDSINNSDLLIKVVEEFYSNYYTWENQLKRIDISNPKTSFTLTHGDFHAGNVMVPNLQYKSVSGVPEKTFYLLDWSEIGINCPFADVAQFIISNCNNVEFRRANEEKLFKSYWNSLIESGKVNIEHFPFEYCFKLYKRGGIERWIVLDSMMSTMVDGDHFVFFMNQLSNFIIDHYNPSLFQPF